MYTYIIIVLALVAVSLFLINFGKFEKFRTDNKRTFDFVMSLISTFTGFFIALSLNTGLNNIQQKNNLVKLLNASNLAIQNSQQRTQGSYLNNIKNGANVTDLLTKIPVELPRIYSSLEDNTLVTSYFSSNGFQAYIMCIDGMETLVKNLNASVLNDGQKVTALNTYMNYLGLAQKINTLEINRLSGEITQGEEDKQLSSLTSQLAIQ